MKIKTHKWGIFLSTGALFLGTAFLGVGALQSSRAFADDGSPTAIESFVTIYDEGQKTIVKSADMTVREILESASIQIDEDSDIVEPGLDAEVSERNFYVNIYRARPVLITDGSQTFKLMTASTVPADVAKAAGIDLFPEDVVEITTEGNFLASGISFSYQVVRAKLINFDYYGTAVSARTQAKTIGDFLHEREIALTADDWLSASAEQEIMSGMALSLYRNGTSTIVVEEAIGYSEKIIHDYDKPQGFREVTTPGKEGQRAVTYEIEMYAGREVSRNKISEIVTSEPIESVVTVGAKVSLPPGSHEDWMRTAGISEADFGYVNYIMTKESGWTWNARNKSSGAYGLCQSLPGNKMASAGADWETNPITQLRWCNGYAVGRYGSWEKAYQFWIVKHWW